MARGKKLVLDAVLVFFVGFIAYFLGYFIRMVLSRQLSLEEFGLFYAVFTFVSFFLVIRDFGTDYSLRKFIPEFLVNKQYGRIKSSIKFVLLINFVVTLIISLFFILFSDFLVKNYFGIADAKPMLYILSVFFIIYSLYGTMVSIFFGFQKSKLYSLDMFLVNLFVLFGVFIFSKYGVLAPAVAYLISVTICLIFGIFMFLKIFSYFKYKDDFSGKLKKKLLNYGFPLLLAAIGFTVIAQIDTLMLTSFRTLEEVGIYNVVLPTAMLLISLGSSLALVMLPFVSEYWASKKFEELSRIIKTIYKNIFVVVVPLSLIVFTFSDSILRYLFGEAFVVGSLSLQILSIGMILFSVATINNSIISAVGRPRLVTKFVLIAAVLNIFLNLVLIPSFGINGAAIATSLAYLTVLIMSSKRVGKFVNVSLPFFDWVKTFISGIIFVWVVFYLRNLIEVNNIFEFAFILFLGGIVYLMFILILKVVSFGEIKELVSGTR